jgi:hypothetical protein
VLAPDLTQNKKVFKVGYHSGFKLFNLVWLVSDSNDPICLFSVILTNYLEPGSL